ncbi:MAG: PhnD/SsuA/transferrin family substrate-binding protein [Chitinophagaceae bacterium]|nr:PhnD/SsuA/transferrin family substrate-binding protein [Chitinophagaceae bacterium]MDP1810502.1 PhnD/SsuA/transferrin family substrate-binding protein [Sediminibacterium sp.]
MGRSVGYSNLIKSKYIKRLYTSIFKNSKSGSIYLLIGFVCIMGCNNQPGDSGPKYSDSALTKTVPVYRFAVHPLHNPAKLIQAYQPLIDYLNDRINGVEFELEASRDYSNFEQKYKNRKLEFLLPNPWQTIKAIKSGYIVIAKAGYPEDFKGVIIVRNDAGIRNPSDLIGKAVSYPSPTALAACVMIQYYLFKQGIDINRDINNIYVGSQESSIMNVYLKKTIAGGTWPPPWRLFQKDHPKEAAELKVIWETEWLINNSVMVRDDIPVEIRNQVQKCLAELHESKQGKLVLAGMETARFIRARNEDYNMVKAFTEKFEKEVRKIDLYDLAK